MGYASRSGRARTSARNPQAFAICDRCALWYNHVDLRWQYDWAGAGLINKRILVCDTCYDEPQNQLRAIIVPADPVPIVNPRVEPYAWDEIDRRQVSGFNATNPQLVSLFSKVILASPRLTAIFLIKPVLRSRLVNRPTAQTRSPALTQMLSHIAISSMLRITESELSALP